MCFFVAVKFVLRPIISMNKLLTFFNPAPGSRSRPGRHNISKRFIYYSATPQRSYQSELLALESRHLAMNHPSLSPQTLHGHEPAISAHAAHQPLMAMPEEMIDVPHTHVHKCAQLLHRVRRPRGAYCGRCAAGRRCGSRGLRQIDSHYWRLHLASDQAEFCVTLVCENDECDAEKQQRAEHV